MINSYSVYGQATAPIADNTNLTLGLRFTRDEVSGRGDSFLIIPGVGTVPAAPVYTDSETFEEPTWKAAIDHHFTEDLMAYASVSRGYKAGTFNTGSLDTPPAKPEIVDAYEIGMKSEFADSRIRLNGAVFWNEIKDPQVITFITKGLVASQGLTNAQKARVKGAEIGIEALATDALKLRGAATYLDAKFVDFNPAPFYSLGPVNVIGPVAGDASGNSLPNVPELRFDVGANYTVDNSFGEWVGDVSAAYTDEFAWNADNRVAEKAVTLVNASLSFTPSSKDYLTFRIWGNNLGDVEYYAASQEFSGPAGTGGDIAMVAAPRTYGASISVKY